MNSRIDLKPTRAALSLLERRRDCLAHIIAMAKGPQLQKLDQRAEIAVLSASAMARPPEIERVNALAWTGHNRHRNFGFADPSNAYLLRPRQEII